MDADGNNPAPNAQPVNLKIENVKIPDFHGVPSKDSTTAQSLIQRINNLSQANNWDTTIAFHHFAIALKLRNGLNGKCCVSTAQHHHGNGSNQYSEKNSLRNRMTPIFWINCHT